MGYFHFFGRRHPPAPEKPVVNKPGLAHYSVIHVCTVNIISGICFGSSGYCYFIVYFICAFDGFVINIEFGSLVFFYSKLSIAAIYFFNVNGKLSIHAGLWQLKFTIYRSKLIGDKFECIHYLIVGISQH